jgi:hypothetical protein
MITLFPKAVQPIGFLRFVGPSYDVIGVSVPSKSASSFDFEGPAEQTIQVTTTHAAQISDLPLRRNRSSFCRLAFAY